jgi:hypothetical protein
MLIIQGAWFDVYFFSSFSISFNSARSISLISREGTFLMEGKLNEYLHDVDEECYERMELLVEQMKVGKGITEELKQVIN